MNTNEKHLPWGTIIIALFLALLSSLLTIIDHFIPYGIWWLNISCMLISGFLISYTNWKFYHKEVETPPQDPSDLDDSDFISDKYLEKQYFKFAWGFISLFFILIISAPYLILYVMNMKELFNTETIQIFSFFIILTVALLLCLVRIFYYKTNREKFRSFYIKGRRKRRRMNK